jgi:hypothetical protein
MIETDISKPKQHDEHFTSETEQSMASSGLCAGHQGARMFKKIAFIVVASTVAIVSTSPASARDWHHPHHKMCHMDRHHHRICR